MKKGLEWEVIPERREAVDREMELYQDNRGSCCNSSCSTKGDVKGERVDRSKTSTKEKS